MTPDATFQRRSIIAEVKVMGHDQLLSEARRLISSRETLKVGIPACCATHKRSRRMGRQVARVFVLL